MFVRFNVLFSFRLFYVLILIRMSSTIGSIVSFNFVLELNKKKLFENKIRQRKQSKINNEILPKLKFSWLSIWPFEIPLFPHKKLIPNWKIKRRKKYAYSTNTNSPKKSMAKQLQWKSNQITTISAGSKRITSKTIKAE